MQRGGGECGSHIPVSGLVCSADHTAIVASRLTCLFLVDLSETAKTLGFVNIPMCGLESVISATVPGHA